MSELEAIQGIINGQQFELYFKSEADKVIAEKDKEIAELQKQVHDYAQGLYVIQEKAEKEICHHKYKKCLAMAEVLEHVCPMTNRKAKWRDKWHKRWLTLADKYKDGNV